MTATLHAPDQAPPVADEPVIIADRLTKRYRDVPIVGAIALPTEVRYRTITSTNLAVPSRHRIAAAKAITVAVAGATLAMLVQGAVLAGTHVFRRRDLT